MTHRSNQLKSCSRYRRPRKFGEVFEFSERSAARSNEEQSKREFESEEDVEGLVKSRGLLFKKIDSEEGYEEEDGVGEDGKDAGEGRKIRREARRCELFSIAMISPRALQQPIEERRSSNSHLLELDGTRGKNVGLDQLWRSEGQDPWEPKRRGGRGRKKVDSQVQRSTRAAWSKAAVVIAQVHR